MPKMTEQFATWRIVAYLIDPANNFIWWDSVGNNTATRRTWKGAVVAEASPGHGGAGMNYTGDPLVLEAAELADWQLVMRVLAAASRAYYR